MVHLMGYIFMIYIDILYFMVHFFGISWFNFLREREVHHHEMNQCFFQ